MQICENGAVVPNPEANPGLVRDCAYLLTAEDALAGVATLDWGAGTPIGEWEGGTPGRVRKLELASRGLSGRIPAELGGLTELRSLRLQRNRLSGAIPRALGAPGTLASLDLSHNQLSGAIPEQLGALQDLWFLSLEGNELTGAIPATLGALSSLGRLRLSDNQLSGAIPASLGDLSALWMLRLNGNALTGPVPESLGALPTLWELRLDDNQLRGAIAQALGSASNLRLLYLDGNAGLTGCIPAALRTVRHSDLADLGLADCADPAPLTLTLSGGREQCTAGTLSRAGWSIAGGVAPYTLTVAGEAVDADDVGVDVTCGALPEDGSETPGTITALVTDATGATTTASAAYTIVAPLPAPTGIVAYAQRTSIGIDWKRAAAAGPVPVFADCPCPLYLRRWRVAGTDVWSTALTRDRTSSSGQTLAGSSHYSLREGTTYEFQIATLRDEIEQETPEALVWSAPVTATTIAPATGVRAVATHDTVTVTWDPQPAARAFWVSVDGPRGRGGDSASFSADGDAPHRVVFRHLPPGAKWVARVTVAAGAYDSPRTETAARTSAPPPDWTPLPRGPQNVRTSVTHDSVTLRWDPPYPEAHNYYSVWLHPRTERIGPYTESSQRGSASGGVTEHTFRGLGSDSTYEISVSHAGVVFTEVEMTVTTAPWLPPPAATPVLPYKRFDRTGRALSPGSYAFLDGAGQAVTTYEGLRDGTVTGLRIHQVDADGTSRADSFGAAAVGDVFEWRQAEDCWVRYQVTSLLPDPAGSAPRKRFAISWVTYAGTGCSGAVAPYTVVRVRWHPTPIVSGSITSPVHHGPYVLHPPDWEGELPEEVTITLPEPPEGAPPTRSDDDSLWPSRDLTVVRQHPLWREPDLPEGWTLSWAQAQNGPGQPYGREGVFVTSHYDGPDGTPAMSTVVELIARRPANIIPTTGISGGGIFETRVIDGHTALLYHNPSGASYNPAGYRHYWTFVMIFDATTSIGYNVSVYVPTFTELDAVIAIARSLYR